MVERSVSLKRGRNYGPVGVEGEWNSDYAFDLKHLHAMHPEKVRRLVEFCPWYDIKWLKNSPLPPSPREYEFETRLPDERTVEEGLRTVFQSLTKETVNGIDSWQSSAKRFNTRFEWAICDGLLSSMTNARGRDMAQQLFDHLFSKDQSLSVLNVGGGAGSDAVVKEISFTPKFVGTPTREPSEVCGKGYNLRMVPTPKRHMDDLESESPSKKTKKFVPDLCVEKKVEDSNGSCISRLEVLIISIKSGDNITMAALDQIKYAMLPVVLRQNTVLGVVICAMEAQLIKLTLNNDDRKIIMHSREYEFNNGDTFMFDEFQSMYSDIKHYATEVLEEAVKV